MALGFYGGARKLPHPPVSLSVFLVVENGIRAAWELMRTDPRPGFDLLTAVEDEVTHELYQRLYDEVFNKNVVEGFDRQLLTDITRESKVRNYDGTNLDKMPDLIFGLVDRPNVFRFSQDWIFVECKPVDSSHSVGFYYCGKGIIRFIKGEYAWAMTSALMVAYTRTGYTVIPKLTNALQASSTDMHTLDFPYQCRKSKAGPSSEVVHITRHSRTFIYIETKRPAEAITIRHLWLKRD
ncbi:MAG: hypothetical protein AUG51_10130 [Acidobacteria bacterium 13_1_20CM_3_53_8]|nr:MAG: hypothetical protein AUG51_10130 [Acidobacteria bacterium 13_1_20CM_3_53_8]